MSRLTYSQQLTWDAMVPVRKVGGTEIRLDTSTAKFGAVILGKLVFLRDIKALEKRIAMTAEPVKAIPVSSIGHEVRVEELVAAESGERFRTSGGHLTGPYYRYVEHTPELEQRLQALIAPVEKARAALRELEKEADAAYRAFLAEAPKVTAATFKREKEG